MALHNFHINQGGPSAHSHTRQTLLGQISQEELDHWNHILLLLVLEKLCSLIEIQAVTSRHLLDRTPSSWKETLLIHMSRKVLWPCVEANETAPVSVQWLCVLSYPPCSSAVFHSQLPDSASKASLPCLQTLAQEPYRSTWQGSKSESGEMTFEMLQITFGKQSTTFECYLTPLFRSAQIS